MNWRKIKTKYPEKFLILTDYKEKRIHKCKIKITDAIVVSSYDDGNEMMSEYRKLKKNGWDVIFYVPQCKDAFIIEEVPSMRVYS